MKIGTEKSLKVYRIATNGCPMCSPIDGSRDKVMLKPRPGESVPNALGLNVGDGVYARITENPPGFGFHISTLYAPSLAAFEKMMQERQRPAQQVVTQATVRTNVPDVQALKIEAPVQKKQKNYQVRAILYDVVSNMFLCLGNWEPGNGPEKTIQTERYGTVQVNGIQYSWALRKVETGENASRVASLLGSCGHPEVIRRARWPGKTSTPEKPTSMLETILDMKDGESESELLRYILERHLRNEKPVEYAAADLQADTEVEFKGHIGFAANRCVEG